MRLSLRVHISDRLKHSALDIYSAFIFTKHILLCIFACFTQTAANINWNITPAPSHMDAYTMSTSMASSSMASCGSSLMTHNPWSSSLSHLYVLPVHLTVDPYHIVWQKVSTNFSIQKKKG
jgi:hypothetical protein